MGLPTSTLNTLLDWKFGLLDWGGWVVPALYNCVWDAGICAGNECSPVGTDRLAADRGLSLGWDRRKLEKKSYFIYTSSRVASLNDVSDCAVRLGHNADCIHEVAL